MAKGEKVNQQQFCDLKGQITQLESKVENEYVKLDARYDFTATKIDSVQKEIAGLRENTNTKMESLQRDISNLDKKAEGFKSYITITGAILSILVAGSSLLTILYSRGCNPEIVKPANAQVAVINSEQYQKQIELLEKRLNLQEEKYNFLKEKLEFYKGDKK